MPVNTSQYGETIQVPAYKPTSGEKKTLERLRLRTDYLRTHRTKLRANPYDNSTRARSIEQVWDFCDYVSLPHKYAHKELLPWQANNSRPLIFSKIDTALSVLTAKNPEVELIARKDTFEKKTKVLTALYNISWDKGHGQQQLFKFIYDLAKYGFAVGREYHRFEEQEVQELSVYDPIGANTYETRTAIKHNEPYFETLPIRDCWFDDRAKPYDEDSMRDWFWEVQYDYSTFLAKFGKYPNSKFVNPGYGAGADSVKDKANVADEGSEFPQVRLIFYEDRENNEFIIADKYTHVLLAKEPLMNNELSCVTGMWRIRNDFSIYGIGLCEILENDQELLDRVSNMTINQIMLAIGGAGFYGGTGNITAKDAMLEPKLKKLRDADKINFPKIPMPDANVFTAIDDLRNEADEISGVTKSLGGEEVGKTLGEAVLNREAGLRRLAIPLGNIEFALERHARLRIFNLQRIYMRPQASTLVKDATGTILDEKLYAEYQQERQRLGENSPQFISKFPSDPTTGVIFRSQFRSERLPLEKTAQGEVQPTPQDSWMEITPEEIEGEYDVKIRAFSTLPDSKALEESRALETFNLIAQLPYTDIYKAQQRLLKKRGEDPDEWMQSQQEIIQKQQQAAQMQQMGIPPNQGGQPIPTEAPGGAPTQVPSNSLEMPASSQGLSAQVNQMR